MTPLDARELLDIAASGVGATMLARRWQSAQLVRVDNDTIERLLNNPDIIAALEGIEAFRNLGKDLTKVINSEKALAKLEREKTPKNTEDKREEKENKSFKKELREKLLKFVSRVPVFMYLTDYREETLKDVIMQLERPLFTKVTGLQIKDFEKMCEIGVFNSQALNSAIFSFDRLVSSLASFNSLFIIALSSRSDKLPSSPVSNPPESLDSGAGRGKLFVMIIFSYAFTFDINFAFSFNATSPPPA
jgi:3-methyladenine DNA glycosylase Tag